jgi:hypothetical protein
MDNPSAEMPCEPGTTEGFVLLDDGRLHAELRRLDRGGVPTRPGAYDYEIKFHLCFLKRMVKRRQNRRANPAPSLATSQPEKAPDKKPARTRAAWPGRV